MTTTKKIIVGVIVLVLLVGGVLWFLSMQKNSDGTTQVGNFSIKSFLPFGNSDEALVGENIDSSSNSSDQNSQNTNGFGNTSGINGGVASKLRKISDKPVAGSIVFNVGTSGVVRFVEKATGNVYEGYRDTAQIKRLTNETMPRIMRAFWLKDGSGFLAQTLSSNDVIETSFVRLKSIGSTTTNGIPYEAVISKLPTGIKEIAVSPDSKKIFYLTFDIWTRGFTANPDGTGKVEVFSNFLNEWNIEWPSANNILISSKASAGAESYGFTLNPSTKSLKKLYSSLFGVSSLLRGDGKYTLLSIGGDAPVLLLKENASSTVLLGTKTISEKCAWDPTDSKFIFCGVPKSFPKGSYPDDWYKGSVSTNDLVQKINIFDLYGYVLSDVEAESKEKVDVTNLQLSKDGKTIIFTNKADQSLWVLQN